MNIDAIIVKDVADRDYIWAIVNHTAQPPDAAFAEQRARLVRTYPLYHEITP